MPSLINTAPGKDGGLTFFYDLSADDPNVIASRLIDNADSAFVYQSRLNGQQSTVTPDMVSKIVSQGGMVAGKTTVGGSEVTAAFMPNGQLCLKPDNSDQMICDMFLGSYDGPTASEAPGYGYDDIPGYAERGANDDFVAPDYQSMPNAAAGADRGSGTVPPGFMDNQGVAVDEYGRPDVNAGLAQSQGGGQSQPGGLANGEMPVGVGEWVLALVLMSIPLVNIIMLILWMVSKKTKKSKKNFAIAYFVYILVVAVISGLIFFFAGNAIISFARSQGLLPQQTAAVSTNASNASNSSNSASSLNSSDDDDEDADGNTASSNANSSSNRFNSSNSSSSSSSGNSTNAFNMSNSSNSSNLSGFTGAYGSADASLDGVTFGTITLNGAPTDVVIVTMTFENSTSTAMTPAEALDVHAEQNGQLLPYVSESFSGYASDGVGELVEPGDSFEFQAAYTMSGNSDIKITIMDKATGSVLAENNVRAAR